MPYPLLPLHLSLVSCLTIGVPSFVLALEPNKSRIRGRFMTNVLKEAMPGGITNLCMILLLEMFCAVFSFPTEQLYTMSAVIIGFVGILVLFEVCKPMDWKRGILCGIMSIAMLLSVTLFGEMFGFTALDSRSGLVLGVMLVLTFFIMLSALRIKQWLRHLIRFIRLYIRKKQKEKEEFTF